MEGKFLNDLLRLLEDDNSGFQEIEQITRYKQEKMAWLEYQIEDIRAGISPGLVSRGRKGDESPSLFSGYDPIAGQIFIKEKEEDRFCEVVDCAQFIFDRYKFIQNSTEAGSME